MAAIPQSHLTHFADRQMKTAQILRANSEVWSMLETLQRQTNHNSYNFTCFTKPSNCSEHYHKQLETILNYQLQPSEIIIATPFSGNCTDNSFNNLKFEHKTGNPEDFLLQVQIEATQAYQTRCLHQFHELTHHKTLKLIAATQAASQAALDNAVNEKKNRRSKKFFQAQCRTSSREIFWIKRRQQQYQILCTVARRQMVFFELCTSDDWTRYAFNEESSSLSENMVAALTKLTQQQDELKQQQTNLSKRINILNLRNTADQNYARNNRNQNRFFRGNNRFNNSRGFRGREKFS